MKLQMRLNQGPNDDVDGHEMNKIRQHARAYGFVFERHQAQRFFR